MKPHLTTCRVAHIATFYWLGFGMFCFLLLVGCSNQPELARVTGIVTAEGRPLEKAVVIFEPQGAPASRGITDSQGRYELYYLGKQKGARLGAHRVRVFAGSEELAEDSYIHYRTGDKLSAEVASGLNAIDFNLTLQRHE